MTHKSPGTKRVRDTAKKEKFDGLKDKAESAVSLDELAEVLRESIGIMRTYNSAPTKTCFGLLDAIHERLAAHHELTDAVDDASTFSTVLSRAVVSPVESIKNAPLLSSTAATTTPASYTKVVASASPSPKPKPPPLPRGAEQRILVRFNGPPPSLLETDGTTQESSYLRRRYDQILEEVNAHLAQLSLPGLLFVQKEKNESNGLFLAPLQGEEGVAILTERWDVWGPGILPGARIVPVATHTFIQIDGVQFGSVQSLSALKTEFEVRNPELGPVVGEPRWKNTPPNAERVAFLASVGRKVPKAGSLVLQRQSRHMFRYLDDFNAIFLIATRNSVGGVYLAWSEAQAICLAPGRIQEALRPLALPLSSNSSSTDFFLSGTFGYSFDSGIPASHVIRNHRALAPAFQCASCTCIHIQCALAQASAFIVLLHAHHIYRAVARASASRCAFAPRISIPAFYSICVSASFRRYLGFSRVKSYRSLIQSWLMFDKLQFLTLDCLCCHLLGMSESCTPILSGYPSADASYTPIMAGGSAEGFPIVPGSPWGWALSRLHMQTESASAIHKPRPRTQESWTVLTKHPDGHL
ncbi:hypothetical protein R3P38DRAFT_3478480 [Favolaschia claudopus]|uniref:Uncharacterized protein n=1 Tax=Favolaschia claudopus TaxID=2862362 RepID=A0AAV9Z9T2_9AGAR